MVSVDSSYNTLLYNKGINSSYKSQKLEEFITATNNEYNKMHKPSTLKKFSAYTSVTTPIIGAFVALGVFAGLDIKKAKKISKEVLKQKEIRYVKGFALLSVVSAIVSSLLVHHFEKKHDKNIQIYQDKFEKLNGEAHAKLSDNIFYSNVLGAMFNPINGKVETSKMFIDDPFAKRKVNGLLKHELTHARQFETIARDDDGVQKLNFAIVNKIAKNFKKNSTLSNYINELYNDLAKDTSGQYDDVTIKLDGADVNLKKYITALHTVLTEPQATYNDIPIIIDEDFYNKIREEKGALSPKEKEKAKKYYEAELNYPELNAFTVYNPFSDYYNNLLEKEAYRAGSPKFAKFIEWINNFFK